MKFLGGCLQANFVFLIGGVPIVIGLILCFLGGSWNKDSENPCEINKDMTDI